MCALGLGDRLVAVTHECDYPPEVSAKPQVTASVIDSDGLSSREIDTAVRESLTEQATIYHLDRDGLERLRPDLILTQELCAVCAVGPAEVRAIVTSLSHQPEVASLEPRTIDEIMDSILLVGRLTGSLRAAIELTDSLRRRLEVVQKAVGDREHPRVLTLEWMDPVFVGGHWVPEMVALAGGHDVLGLKGEPSWEVAWSEIVARAPEVVVAMPCGFGLARTVQELEGMTFPVEWAELPAVESGQVYAVDGSSYFNRPGPRIVDGVEMLAAILHPDVGIQASEGSYRRIRTTTRSL